MRFTVTTDTIISVIALLTSLSTLFYTIRSTRKQQYMTALMSNLTSLSEVERMAADDPKILELHGIDPNDLKKAGISSNEFAYLLSNFTLGGVYFRTIGKRTGKPFAAGGYRYNMLKSPRTRKAWPILKQFLVANAYRESIEATIELIEKDEKGMKKPGLRTFVWES